MVVAKRCSRCKHSFYCSRRCQIKDWSNHKRLCQVIADRQSGDQEMKISHKLCMDQTANNRIQSDKEVNNSKDSHFTQTFSAFADNERTEKHSESNDNDAAKFVNITVMSNKKKHKLNVNITLSSTQMWDNIAAKIHVPAEQLKMIHKGHKIDKDDIHRVMAEKAVFQAIGMESLNEEGLDPDNISYIMRKMSTDRNTAISALRLKGDVIDAILYLGNR
ncbi:hypothetical protein BSL78_18830 [Apostichopus japonicus]|uniref:MYND-type domain-containing protein n=1 Tax=Stichopus japonicus TaxID=307972 RepID=A0A2G8K8N1_STIJA|nr:hypothetical protein BSL78_18830 [Apostichopus japonicus]